MFMLFIKNNWWGDTVVMLQAMCFGEIETRKKDLAAVEIGGANEGFFLV